jgi:hypothetical protein
MREQQRAQSADPCNDRREHHLCSECDEFSDEETDDLGRCLACIPVCRVCGAVDGGSQVDPEGRCVDCRVTLIYTNAPASYDYWYTSQIKACAGIDSRGKAWRCVRVADDRVEAQSDRYRSGWHAAMPPRDWQKAITAGVVTVPGGAS